MKPYNFRLSILICLLLTAVSCASIPPAEFVHMHMDELWGKTKEEIINLIPEDHLTYADIRSAKLVLHHAHNLDYGHWVMVPGLKESITYYFHNSQLYKISIEVASNEFTDLKQKNELYKNYRHLVDKYTQSRGPADTSSSETAEPADESSSEINCAQFTSSWKSDTRRSVHTLTSIILEYTCFTQPIELIRLRETYIHENYKP